MSDDRAPHPKQTSGERLRAAAIGIEAAGQQNGYEWPADRNTFLAALDAWRRDWERNEVGCYLAHCTKDLRTRDMGLAGKMAHERRVSAGRSGIKGSLENLGVFRDPGRTISSA